MLNFVHVLCVRLFVCNIVYNKKLNKNPKKNLSHLLISATPGALLKLCLLKKFDGLLKIFFEAVLSYRYVL